MGSSLCGAAAWLATDLLHHGHKAHGVGFEVRADCEARTVSRGSCTTLSTRARVSRHTEGCHTDDCHTDDCHTDDCHTDDRETHNRNTLDHNTTADPNPTPSASCGW